MRPGELVFDIGAGEGALTAHLVRAGARVVAVELHPRRVGVLRERFPGITVVHADAASIRLPGRPFRVVANPPYGISSRLLRTLLAPNSGLVAADLVLQRALVCKFASRNARRFTLTVGLMLPRRAFLPPPHVDSAVLVVRAGSAVTGRGGKPAAASRCTTFARSGTLRSMSTTRPRYQITETPEVAQALDRAAQRWPGEPRSKLLRRLIIDARRSAFRG